MLPFVLPSEKKTKKAYSPTVVVLFLPFFSVNPLRPNNDLSQTSHCNIKAVSVIEVMRIENKITPVKFY